jgi:hypothetical protein
MSEFFKLAYDLIAQIVYNLAEWVVNFFKGFVKLFITGWADYTTIFSAYFKYFSFPIKILAILLMLILIAIPVVLFVILLRRIIIDAQIRAAKDDNVTLYREIGRLNRQVVELIDEKSKILAMKVGTTTGVMPAAVGAEGAVMEGVAVGGVTVAGAQSGAVLTSDGSGYGVMGGVPDPLAAPAAAVPMAAAVVGGNSEDRTEDIKAAAAAAATAVVTAKNDADLKGRNTVTRFPKLSLVDIKYAEFERPDYNDSITLQEFTENYRLFAASQMKLYYTPEIIRRFVAGMAASKLLILEGISGTGKTSLPYSFSRYINNPATMVSVQPSYRDRTELIGYFNEFSKRFNETEFLRALYEAGYRDDPSYIVLDEMNLARIEYYFAEMLSVLELPNTDEWTLDLVPTAWPGVPVKL